MQQIRMLMRYKSWADDLIFTAVAALPELEQTAPRPIVFGSLVRTLNHACAMDQVWRCHLLGVPHGLTTRNPDHCPGIDELAAKQRSLDQWYVQYADAATGADLAEELQFEFIGGGMGRMTRAEILMHVVNHATYHRGHVAAMLYGIGVPPPTTDLPVFLRQSPRAIRT